MRLCHGIEYSDTGCEEAQTDLRWGQKTILVFKLPASSHCFNQQFCDVYPPQTKFFYMFDGWWLFPLRCYSDLQLDAFCALCFRWNQRWTDKTRETSQRESSASRCGFWIRLYPGIQYRNISSYRAQRALYLVQESKPLYLQCQKSVCVPKCNSYLDFYAKDKTLEIITDRDRNQDSTTDCWVSFPPLCFIWLLCYETT